jgi:hypothetical protein
MYCSYLGAGVLGVGGIRPWKFVKCAVLGGEVSVTPC